MLGIFSCDDWPFAYLLCIEGYSLLPIFKLSCHSLFSSKNPLDYLDTHSLQDMIPHSLPHSVFVL